MDNDVLYFNAISISKEIASCCNDLTECEKLLKLVKAIVELKWARFQ